MSDKKVEVHEMTVTYFNGKFIDIDEKVIPIEERGHNFGDGIYDVIRSYKNKPFMLEEHLDRIFMSAEAINLKLERTREEFKNELLMCLEKSGEKNADIYLQITRGIATRNHLFPSCPVSLSIIVKPTQTFQMGDENALMFYPDERWANCHIKSLNLLPNILARQTAIEKGFAEAVLVKDGYVTEGTCTSVFIVKDKSIIVTPLSKQILSGITRMAVKEIAKTLKIPYIERNFTPEEMKSSDEVFIAGTLIEVMAITRVEDQEINQGIIGEITKELQRALMDLTTE